jgi:hypothetical protein
MEWELFRLVFESKLSADGKELAGEMLPLVDDRREHLVELKIR